MKFAERVVLITGAGSGIGRALAAGFCSDGAQVLGFGRTSAALEETARLHGRGRMRCLAGDLAEERDVERLFDECLRHYGRVDVLVNNAAVYPKRSFAESSAQDWRTVLAANVIGMASCCRLALPGMLQRGHGRIINLGSFAWMKPIPASAAYAASKGAVWAMTKAIAAEIDRSRYPDVLINLLVPGEVRTAMSEHGEEPAAVYPHARHLAELPAGGPSG